VKFPLSLTLNYLTHGGSHIDSK